MGDRTKIRIVRPGIENSETLNGMGRSGRVAWMSDRHKPRQGRIAFPSLCKMESPTLHSLANPKPPYIRRDYILPSGPVEDSVSAESDCLRADKLVTIARSLTFFNCGTILSEIR